MKEYLRVCFLSPDTYPYLNRPLFMYYHQKKQEDLCIETLHLIKQPQFNWGEVLHLIKQPQFNWGEVLHLIKQPQFNWGEVLHLRPLVN